MIYYAIHYSILQQHSVSTSNVTFLHRPITQSFYEKNVKNYQHLAVTKDIWPI